MKWTDRVDAIWVTMASIAVVFGLYLAVMVGIIAPHREADRCYRWLGAASTPRDTLWVTVLRPECAELLPPRKP